MIRSYLVARTQCRNQEFDLMRIRLTTVIAGIAVAVLIAVAVRPTATQSPAAGISRTADGRPDLNGIWEALNTANWDLQDHAARKGPVSALGAAYSVPAARASSKATRFRICRTR